MTHRKRTSKAVPAVGRLMDIADRLWSIVVRAQWGHVCAVCGEEGKNAHHLIPREFHSTRHDTQNGICLCAYCHRWRKTVSPHQNAAGWMEWLAENHPGCCARYVLDPCPAETGEPTPDVYLTRLRELRPHVEDDEFRAVVGSRLADFLELLEQPE